LNGEVVSVKSNENNNKRGLHIVVINPNNGKVEAARVFDTYVSSVAFDDFIIESYPDGFIIVAACKDDCITKLSKCAK